MIPAVHPDAVARVLREQGNKARARGLVRMPKLADSRRERFEGLLDLARAEVDSERVGSAVFVEPWVPVVYRAHGLDGLERALWNEDLRRAMLMEDKLRRRTGRLVAKKRPF